MNRRRLHFRGGVLFQQSFSRKLPGGKEARFLLKYGKSISCGSTTNEDNKSTAAHAVVCCSCESSVPLLWRVGNNCEQGSTPLMIFQGGVRPIGGLGKWMALHCIEETIAEVAKSQAISRKNQRGPMSQR